MKTRTYIFIMLIFAVFTLGFNPDWVSFAEEMTSKQLKAEISRLEAENKKYNKEVDGINIKLKGIKVALISGEVINTSPLIVFGSALSYDYIKKDAYFLIEGKSGYIANNYFSSDVYKGTRNYNGIQVNVFGDGTIEQEKLISRRGTLNSLIVKNNEQISDLKLKVEYKEYSDSVGTSIMYNGNEYFGKIDTKTKKPNGKGILYNSNYPENDEYAELEGVFVQGKLSGNGILRKEEYKYTGAVTDFKPNGFGKLVISDVNSTVKEIEGVFKDGKCNGKAYVKIEHRDGNKSTYTYYGEIYGNQLDGIYYPYNKGTKSYSETPHFFLEGEYFGDTSNAYYNVDMMRRQNYARVITISSREPVVNQDYIVDGNRLIWNCESSYFNLSVPKNTEFEGVWCYSINDNLLAQETIYFDIKALNTSLYYNTPIALFKGETVDSFNQSMSLSLFGEVETIEKLQSVNELDVYRVYDKSSKYYKGMYIFYSNDGFVATLEYNTRVDDGFLYTPESEYLKLYEEIIRSVKYVNQEQG